MNGKQVRIKLPELVEGMSADEFMMRTADPIWLHKNEMWELIPVEDPYFDVESDGESEARQDEDRIPF